MNLQFIKQIIERKSFKEMIYKLLEVVLCYPFYFLSFLFPRSKSKIVFGSHTPFNDNSKYLFLYASHYLRGKKIIWIAQNRQIATKIRKLGYRSYYRWSLLGVWHCLTAYTYVFCFHLIDINFWTSGGALRINLWHGVGIKRIEFNVKNGPSAKVYNIHNIFSRISVPYIFKRPHYFVSTSDFMSDHNFQRAFRIGKEECLNLGYPRNDVLFWNKNEILKFVDDFEGAKIRNVIEEFSDYSKIYLYMPTWRDSRKNFILQSGFDFSALNELMIEKNSLFLLKLHMGTNIDLSSISILSHVKVLDHNMDIYPILSSVDVLVTDYSSIYYDFILMENKSILLFPFDYDEYKNNNRDLLFDYEKYTPGKRVYNFDDFLNALSDDKYDMSYRDWVINKFWGDYKGEASKKICSFLNSKI